MRKKLLVIAILLFTLLAAKVTCNATEMLKTTDFKSGVSLPWKVDQSNEMNSWSEIRDGEFLVHVNKNGQAKWDVQLRHREISIIKGHTYRVHFKLYADKPQKIYATIGDTEEPYSEAWSNKWKAYDIPAGGGILEVNETFTSTCDCRSAQFAFQFGGPDPYDSNGDCSAPVPQVIHFVEMSLQDDRFLPTPAPTATPDRFIRVNQLGYFPNAVKHATIVTNATSPIEVQLKDKSGKVVWVGRSVPKGTKDIASGENVQILDFSDFMTVGKDYQLVAGTIYSFPFDIGTDMYSQMKYDALKYFYYERSGIEITMPYCNESRWEREALHPNDTVRQHPGKTFVTGNGSKVQYTGPSTINGAGGWYDSDNYGKYVVNGGLTTWILQNQYERSKIRGTADAYADGTMNIPQMGDSEGVPDLLDETRWNVEFFLNVQTTSGSMPGMVIHKISYEKWPALGLGPVDEIDMRYYYPVSTAATLNFAAVTAQASRLWKEYDTKFATQCLKQSETAWKAALEHPNIYAPYGRETYGSTYGDNDVRDEFYWAACELFITTGKSEYLDYLKSSKHASKCPTTLSGESDGTPGSMDWGNTVACGTIDLVLCQPKGLPEADLKAASESIAAAADTYIAVQAKEGYEVPLEVSTYINEFGGQMETIINGYPWRSNLYIVNQSIILAYACDLTRHRKYINGVTKSMDYIMGRNPNIKCYVSGYGENPLKYPHHRLFCPQIDRAFPSVPPGFLSSGPNSGAQDPWAVGSGLKGNGAPAQKCYIDHVESWSTNEVTMNLNASLAWLTGYLDEFRANQFPSYPPTDIGYPTPTVRPFNPDIDGNGFVNISDIMMVVTAFNSSAGDGRYIKEYDLDKNGAININDIMMLLPYFNKAV